MGQRCQILLNLINNKGEVSSSLIHEQWGIGRILPEIVLTYLRQANRVKCYRTEDFIPAMTKIFTDNRYNITDELNIPDTLKYVDIKDLKNLKHAISSCDNNNGYAIIQLKQKKSCYEYDVTVGYLMGTEDLDYDYENNKYVGEEPFERYVGIHEWIMRTWGDYNKYSAKACNEFYRDYKNICKSYGYRHITGELNNFKVSQVLKKYDYTIRNTED